MYEGWSDVPLAKQNEIKKKDCFKCYYGSRTTANKKAINYITCDYIHVAKEPRGCLPGTCRENGKFIQRAKKGKRPKDILRLK